MKILKFGGSSLATPDRIRTVAKIILTEAKQEPLAVVVSAFQGVTNQLIQCARLAEKGDTEYESFFAAIAVRHRKTVEALASRPQRRTLGGQVDAMLKELSNVLHGIFLLRDCSPRALDLVGSFGERLSAIIVAAHLNHSHPAEFADAREFVVTDDHFTHAGVLFDQTNKTISSYFKKLKRKSKRRVIAVVTGFIGATEDGRTTTIGRNGSDYTASMVGAAIGASLIEIWTDVDGVMSADPRTVPSAFVLPEMSYEEAMELSYFGATVLHSATIAPAVARGIPILIKNTLNPAAPGTLISKRSDNWDGVAKGISSIDKMTLLTLRGMSMVGVPGTAERLFRALTTHSVNVILISQASSEHTICFAVTNEDAVQARRAISQEFRFELQHHLTTLDEKTSQTIVAIVGEGMKGTPGVSGKVFHALGRNNVNVSAIAQGASERNISFVIDSNSKVRALNVIHQAFFEKRKRLDLVIIGIGNIGTTLLKQLHQQREYLIEKGFEVRVCGIANSKRSVLHAEGIDLRHWRDTLDRSVSKMDLATLAEDIGRMELTNAALVDCTASSDVVNTYTDFVRANLHIITPNKKANVLPWKEYESLTQLMKVRQKSFLFEANVGAGLPVISTLQDLIASGDVVLRIEGMLSGTLSYLFNQFDGSRPFSELVREAHDLGFTEPDPREDLSGNDVARKLLILARQVGQKINLGDIRVENLVPPSLRKGTFSAGFYKRFSALDANMMKRIKKAKTSGKKLRYVGSVDSKQASAGLREVPFSHPFASTQGSDNIIAFTTHRYSHTPLVVQGPGAGADVTAMGVFSDILKLLNYLPY